MFDHYGVFMQKINWHNFLKSTVGINFNFRLMAKYSKKASDTVGSALHREKEGTLKSGRSGKTVTSREQAIAIGLSEARAKGEKVPVKKSGAKKSSAKKSGIEKATAKKKVAKKAVKKSATKKSGARKKVAVKKSAKRSTAKNSSMM